MTCSNDHPAIQHDEFYCPLCVEMEDRRDDAEAIAKLEGQVEDLAEIIENLSLADTLHLQAQLDTAETAAYAANALVNNLLWAIEHTKPAPLGRYQQRVMQEATKVRLERLKRDKAA